MSVKNKKNAIIIMLTITLLIMAGAYSVLMSELTINGVSRINNNSKFNIYIDSITPEEHQTATSIKHEVGIDRVSATFETTLKKPKDYVNYSIVIKNDGLLDAILSTATFLPNRNSEYISFLTDVKQGTILRAGESMSFNVIIQFNDVDQYNSNETITSTATLNLLFVQYEEGEVTPDFDKKVLASGDASNENNGSIVWNYYSDGTIELTGSGTTKQFTPSIAEKTDIDKLPIINQILFQMITNNNGNNIPSDIFKYDDDTNKYSINEKYYPYMFTLMDEDTIKKYSKQETGVQANNLNDLLNKLVEKGDITDEIKNDILKNKISIVPISKLIISDGITSLGSYIFTSLGYNKSLEIPSTVKEINESAFSNNHITSVTFNEGITNIDSYAFSNNNIMSVILPKSLNVVGKNAFSNNDITSATINSKITLIDNNAFICNPLEKKNITYDKKLNKDLTFILDSQCD